MIWLTVKRTAEIMNISTRMVRINIKNNKYIVQKISGIGGKNGIQYKILLDSLPEDIQEKYYETEREKEQEVYLSLSQKEREIVDYKYNIVMKYKDFKHMYFKQGKIEMFLKSYNEEHPENPLTKRKLISWQKKFNEKGIDGLVDRRGGHNRGQSKIPDDVWNVFLKLWSSESKPSSSQCYEIVKQYFPETDLPQVSAFNRRLAKLPNPYKILYREGEKAYSDKCEPYVSIDYENMYSNQQWVADHHVFDVSVVDEKGKVFRPWLSGWIDRKSRYVVGYAVNKCDPNSDIVLDSFARACIKCGIPDEVLLDNGKDYKTYDLFDTDFKLSVASQLRIKVTNAIPYNAKAKPIERFFGTLEGKYCKFIPSYLGSDSTKRPKVMKKKNEDLKTEVITYSDFLSFVDNMIKDYNNSPSRAKGLNGKTPKEIYENSFTKLPRAVKDEDILHLYLQRTTKPLTIGRNGIYVKALEHHFDDDKLFIKKGERVFARYNIDDISKVYVYDLNDEFICIAKCEKLSQLGNNATTEVLREVNRKKKIQKKLIKASLKNIEVPTIQEVIAEKTKEFEEFDIKNKDCSINFESVKYKHAKSIKKEEERHKQNELPDDEIITESGLTKRERERRLANFYRIEGGL